MGIIGGYCSFFEFFWSMQWTFVFSICYTFPARGALFMEKPGRNDSCPCGSGKKFKKCCEGKGRQIQKGEKNSKMESVFHKVTSILGKKGS